MADRPLPDKQPGDTLSASHINKLSRQAERLAGLGSTGVGGPVMSSGSQIQFAPQSMFQQFIMEITDVEAFDGDKEYTGFYKAKMRWFEADDIEKNEDGDWSTNDDQDWLLDARDLDLPLGEGDKVVAYWDRQRG